MLYKAIILSAGLLLINCKTQKGAQLPLKEHVENSGNQIRDLNNESVIYFNEGENRFLDKYQMNVTFKGISEDSRCPKDVNCVWAGVAVAELEVIGTTTRPMTLSLATLDNKGRNYNQSADFNGYTITLIEVNPYPGSVEGSKDLKGKYKVGITIKKSDRVSTMK
ncbi:hypothetical protein EG349_06825 [Chryseobacterium shandongense]|uniref:Lipoprotein n=1 Tax=Chryseobacterium shandongense TaxID=1493872 RepID=A0A3G6R0C4_9FLAO|nr:MULTISPECIES: hypothetical protein [Chryseobacterium]AZA58283.1 hypothetical protein EG350_14280 [Chryseobacterium shandongense]AZA86520.1 hypothetical protein EG349_06825 [Chryseobacterium shandongense]AZA94929.1 hypothetical protein EG353_04835 [Chryseobacterium shandongense]